MKWTEDDSNRWMLHLDSGHLVAVIVRKRMIAPWSVHIYKGERMTSVHHLNISTTETMAKLIAESQITEDETRR